MIETTHVVTRYRIDPAFWSYVRTPEVHRSLTWLAARGGCSAALLSRVRLRAEYTVGAEVAERIAAALGVPLDRFFVPAVATYVASNATAAHELVTA
jgi:hypothetical protein